MAFTFTVEAAVDAVRIEGPIPAGHDRITITRIGPSGESAGVRSWVDRPVVAGSTIIARDFEAPIGVPLDYLVETYAAASPGTVTSSTATVEIDSAGCTDTWLTDLVRPANTLRVAIEALAALAYAVPTTTHWVLSRRAPIVSSDIAHTPTFELDVLTASLVERDQARAILGNGVPVLLRTPPDLGIGNLYLSVLSFTEARIVAPGQNPARRFAVEAVQVDRPDPGLYLPLAPVTYAYVKAHFATYAILDAQRATYDAVAYDYSGRTPEDVVPWPPDDL